MSTEASTDRWAVGIGVDVLRQTIGRDIVDYTLGGPSASHDRLAVVGVVDTTAVPAGHRAPVAPVPGGTRISTDGTPPMYLLIRRGIGATADRRLFSLIPADPDGPKLGRYMAGGNYAVCTDSRLIALCDGWYGALAIHDRDEGRAR